MIKVKKRGKGYTRKEENYLIQNALIEKIPFKDVVVGFQETFNSSRTYNALSVKMVELRKKSISIKEDINKPKPAKEIDTTYVNGDSSVKENLRKIILKQILKSTTNGGNILSLPADNFKFEQSLLQLGEANSLDFKLHCAEYNESVYKRGVSKAMALKVPYYKMTTNELLGALAEEKFQAMWLDFCGQWSDDIKHSLDIISNCLMMKENGILALTLMGAREVNLEQFKLLLSKKDQLDCTPEELRTIAIPRHISNMFQGNLHLTHLYKYRDVGHNPHCAPMFLYIFKMAEKPEKVTYTEFTSKYLNL